ncbi:MAG: sugar ABC transporter permease [Alphaproteobacteria bacterium]|jgi:multiple sugar transport system permease protein
MTALEGIGAGGAAETTVSAEDFPDWFKKRKARRTLIVNRWVPFTMVALPVVVLLLIVAYPTVWMAYHAFQDTTMVSLATGRYNAVGWGNFAEVLSSDRFRDSVGRLVKYLLFGACLEVLLGTALALILYEIVKSNVLRMVLLILMVLPLMLPPSIVGVIFRFLFNPSNGAINHALLYLGLIDWHIEWFSVDLALWTIIVADVWEWTSLPLLIVYSGRVSLPLSVFEAARVDGASGWLILRRITLPMLKEIIAIAFIIRFMDAYKFVDKIYVMTSGGPAQASELPVFIAFQRGIREFQIGEAAAYSWLIFVVAAVLITLFLKYMKKVLRAQAIVGT